MVATISKMILWLTCLVVVAIITALVIYRLAMWVAAILMLLLLGAIVGIPIFFLATYWLKRIAKESRDHLEDIRRYKP